jgi:hypothetical protein
MYTLITTLLSYRRSQSNRLRKTFRCFFEDFLLFEWTAVPLVCSFMMKNVKSDIRYNYVMKLVGDREMEG